MAKLEEQSGKSLSPKQTEEQNAWNEIAVEYHPDRKTIEDQIAQMRGGYISVFKRNSAYNPQSQGLRYYEFTFCDSLSMMLIGMGLFRAGFLTGKYRSEADLARSPRGQGARKYLNDRGFRVLGALDEVARRYGSTPGGVALAWLRDRPGVTAPIASATSLEQLDGLIAAARLELDPQAVELLDAASA